MFHRLRKAFDSVNHSSVIEALKEIGVEGIYIRIIEEMYRNNQSYIVAERSGPLFPVRKGVKQGDNLSPDLFICTLEKALRRLKWRNKGIEINGTKLNKLEFADDVVLFSTSAEELSGMIEELFRECQAVGLEPNYSKTKLMTNSIQETITINNSTLCYVDDYIYLGQVISFKDSMNKEIQRRLSLGWKKYWSLNFILKSKYEMRLKKLIFDSCVLPVVT